MWAVVDIVFICISLTLLVLETVPEIGVYFSDDSEPLYLFFLILDSLVIAFFRLASEIIFIVCAENVRCFCPQMPTPQSLLTIIRVST